MLKQIKQNVLKSMLSKYAHYAVQLISLIVYMRMFEPQDFGVVALVSTISTFFMLFGEVGIGSALITKKELTHSQRKGIFTFTILLGILVAIIIYGVLYVLNITYERNDFEVVGLFAVFSSFFSIVNSVPTSSLINDNRYYRLSSHHVISEVLSFGVVLLLFRHLPGEIILGIRIAFVQLSALILNVLYTKKTSFGQMALSKDFSGLRTIKSFSVNLFGFNFLNYFSRNLDNLLVGKFFGMAALGAYEKAYVLMRYPLMLVTQAAVPAIQPTLTKGGYNSKEAAKVYEFIAKKVLFFGFVIAFGIHVNANFIVDILFGPKWAEVSSIIAILAVSIPVQLVTSFNGGFWQAADSTKAQFKVSIINALIFIPLLIASMFVLPDFTSVLWMISALLVVTCLNGFVLIQNKLFGISKLTSISSVGIKYSVFLSVLYAFRYLPIENEMLILIISIVLASAASSLYFRNEIRQFIVPKLAKA